MVSKVSPFLMLFATIGFVASDNSCSISTAKDSLHLALKILDLVKANCKHTNLEQVTANYPCKLNPANCADLLALGFNSSGIYKVFPKWNKNIQPFDVYCDQETDGGGWTVFQRRGDFGTPLENFYRNWTDYRNGFGDLTKEFWLGNIYISTLTTDDQMQLRVDLEDFEEERRYATYNNFIVLNEAQTFRMTLSDYNGNAGNGMTHHSGHTFVTHDNGDINNCATNYKGGWWYAKCHLANPNGLNLKGKHDSYANGINWEPFKGYHYSLKTTEMKVRPQFFKSLLPQ